MPAAGNTARIRALEHQIEALRQIIESSKTDDMRTILLDMLDEAEDALTTLKAR